MRSEWIALLGLVFVTSVVEAAPAKRPANAPPSKGGNRPPSGARRPPQVAAPQRPRPAAWRSSDASGSAASSYGDLDEASCRRQLGERRVAYLEAATVGAPSGIRLTGGLRGVEFRGLEPDRARLASPYEVIDCRLALALDDWAEVLAAHDVRTVVHFGIYRPPPRKSGVDPKNPHEHALAIDVARLIKRDGAVLDVEKDWHGSVGGTSCGPTATPPRIDTPAARELRAIVCAAAEHRFFHVLLTPHYNRQHYNHFHLEVMPNTKWLIVR